MHLCATKPFYRFKVIKQLSLGARRKLKSGKAQKEGPKRKSPSTPRPKPRKTPQITPKSQARSEELVPRSIFNAKVP